MPTGFAHFRILLGFCGMAILASGSAMLAHQIHSDLMSFGHNYVTKNPAMLILFAITVTILAVIIFKIYSKKFS